MAFLLWHLWFFVALRLDDDHESVGRLLNSMAAMTDYRGDDGFQHLVFAAILVIGPGNCFGCRASSALLHTWNQFTNIDVILSKWSLFPRSVSQIYMDFTYICSRPSSCDRMWRMPCVSVSESLTDWAVPHAPPSNDSKSSDRVVFDVRSLSKPKTSSYERNFA